ncbi:dihydropteroate synthase [Nitritalea halalkaliphila LW7]|uniref:Dihydropteroate synthase n=1 Tax=Nitritalea halalkaliphila LW7 TaxID=1189621 RepID=I5BY62_9BACT|nr:dihydropteroate synthase [Nitritalea halalkaliphila LW7]
MSGGHLDAEMLPTVAAFRVPYIAMHMRGNPKTMQGLTSYQDLLQEMLFYFAQVQDRCRQAGIHDVIFDPGFGFAKTLEQNYEILRHLNTFPKLLGPILVGISRKSMIYKVIDTDANGALAGTTALHMVALQQGANVLRVHDVLEAVQTIKLFKTLYS